MGHTHKHEHKVWLPTAYTVTAIKDSTTRLRSSDEEFEKAFRVLKRYPKRLTFFGSARLLPEDHHYQMAQKLAARLAKDDFAIVTGGGGGIMEAANNGAHEAGGHSIGFNIMLPHEQKLNNFTTDHLAFHYFFTRKVMMSFYSHGFIFFPGGFGTLDELSETLTLIQTGKMAYSPVILFGNAFWKPFDEFIHNHLLDTGLISAGDEQIYTITEDFDEISSIINQNYNR